MSTYSEYNIDLIRDPELRQIFELIMDIATGHDHDGSNSKSVAGVVGDGTVTNAKLATDVKVGSLASLTTTEKASLVGAINELVTSIAAKYTKDGAGIPSTDMTAAVQTSLGLADSALQSVVGAEATPVNAVASQGTLTVSGVVIDSETVTIDGDVYEFLADAAQSKTDPANVAVDITSYVTASQGTFTVTVQPSNGETFTIGSKTFTFVPVGTGNSDGEVEIGADLAGAQTNIVAAINGTDGVNSAHTQVSAAAFAGNASVITALVGGVAGDSIASTETMANGAFDAATLGTTTAGADCTAANAITAIVTSDVGSTYSIADGAGDTVVCTATTKGVAGDSITTTETMANGAWDAATLGTTTAGVNGTVGTKGDVKFDSSYWYICSADNAINDSNWRRTAHSSY